MKRLFIIKIKIMKKIITLLIAISVFTYGYSQERTSGKKKNETTTTLKTILTRNIKCKKTTTLPRGGQGRAAGFEGGGRLGGSFLSFCRFAVFVVFIFVGCYCCFDEMVIRKVV